MFKNISDVHVSTLNFPSAVFAGFKQEFLQRLDFETKIDRNDLLYKEQLFYFIDREKNTPSSISLEFIVRSSLLIELNFTILTAKSRASILFLLNSS